MLEIATKVRAEELQWAHENLVPIPSLPKLELEGEARGILEMVGLGPLAPVLAANGNDLPLLVDDFGLRTWGKENFGVEGTWLQPVLMRARERGVLPEIEYFKATVELANAGASYVSLDAGCLHFAYADSGYDVKAVSALLDILCGESADLRSNVPVAAKATDLISNEVGLDLRIYRFASTVARCLSYPRWAHARELLAAYSSLCGNYGDRLRDHLSQWLRWNSTGSAAPSSLPSTPRSRRPGKR